MDTQDNPKTDHDLLTTLVETVKNNQQNVLDKIQDVKEKVQEVNDGISTKVNDHEVRLKIIERLVEITSPEKTYQEFLRITLWIQNFKSTYKLTLMALTLISMISGVILTILTISSGTVHIR